MNSTANVRLTSNTSIWVVTFHQLWIIVKD